jgi:hypothetical protein
MPPASHHNLMLFLLAIVITLTSVAGSQPLPSQATDKDELPSVNAPGADKLPPLPGGKSTVIGGEIRAVDPVRDQFTVKVFGGQLIKILFDERTQVYRDGVRISLRDLHPDDHASVETTLDGTTVFALRIHMLSQLPEGEWRGQVVSYNPQIGELMISVGLPHKPFILRVPAGTPIMRAGQDESSKHQGGPTELASGSMVEVRFRGRSGGHGVVTRIDILATPNSPIVFSGNLSFLDLHSGRFVIVDASDSHTHEIVFDPSRFPVSRELHDGLAVKVTTTFDGSRYVAREILIE